MPARKPKTTIRAAVDAELRSLRQTDTVYGRTAQRLASLLDDMQHSRDAAATSRELRLVMEQIRTGASLTEADPLDELAAKRAHRRSS